MTTLLLLIKEASIAFLQLFLVALSDILEAFELPENAAHLSDLEEAAGSDMVKRMQLVFPAMAHMQMGVISKFGFPGDGDGEERPTVPILCLTIIYVFKTYLCFILP